MLFSATCRCKILEECPAPLLKMKKQEFRSWREVVVCVPGKQGHSILALHVAAMDRNVGGPVVCSTTVIAQKRTSLVSALADFRRSQSARESTDYENQVQRDISQLRGAVCKLAAKIMWNSAISDTSNRIQEQIVERVQQRTVVRNVCMSVPTVQEQMNVQVIPGTQVVERIQEQIAETIPQERDQRTVEQNARVSFPAVRQQRNVQEIPGTQVVERIQKQIVETIPQERDQRTVEQNACVSVPAVQEQMIVQGIPGAQVVERIQKQVAETIPQERDQRTVEQNVCMSVPLAAPRAATVAPVDVYTKPAPVIDLMPTPVIEYIAPSAAVSYPSFFPSFDQIHGARVSVPVVQEQMNVQVIPDAHVVERIQEQIAETIPQERD